MSFHALSRWNTHPGVAFSERESDMLEVYPNTYTFLLSVCVTNSIKSLKSPSPAKITSASSCPAKADFIAFITNATSTSAYIWMSKGLVAETQFFWLQVTCFFLKPLMSTSIPFFLRDAYMLCLTFLAASSCSAVTKCLCENI